YAHIITSKMANTSHANLMLILSELGYVSDGYLGGFKSRIMKKIARKLYAGRSCVNIGSENRENTLCCIHKYLSPYTPILPCKCAINHDENCCARKQHAMKLDSFNDLPETTKNELLKLILT